MSRVNFEIASLLNEKGIIIESYSNCWVKTLDGDIIHNSERRNCAEHDRCEVYLQQPTYEEVRKRLRESYQKDITIPPFGIDNYHINLFDKGLLLVNTDNVSYGTYDEALEVAIVKLVKML